MLFIMSLWSVLYISYEIAINDSNTMKHLTGLLSGQFKVLFNFVNDVCPLDKLTYWSYSGKKHSSREPTATQNDSWKSASKWSPEEILFICLL